MFAGSDTIGHVITSGVFNILEQPEIYDRLVAELKEAWPVLQDAPLLQDLEKLPYLVCGSREDLMLVQPQFTDFLDCRDQRKLEGFGWSCVFITEGCPGFRSGHFWRVYSSWGIAQLFLRPRILSQANHHSYQTVVNMAAPIIHRNEDIFPDGQNFVPERWMDSNSENLEKYLVSFSKGARQCLGIKYKFPQESLAD